MYVRLVPGAHIRYVIIIIAMRFEDKLKAVNLRQKGFSYKEISQKLDLTKSTLSDWLKDIELTSEQKQRLMTKKLSSGYKGAKSNQRYAEKRRRIIIERAKKEAPSFICNPLFVAGLMLYWAEGSKGRYERIEFTNSDPELIRLMMRWFREICHVEEKNFKIYLYLHKFHVRKDVRNFWSAVAGVPLNQFRKDIIKPTIHSQRTNKLYEGTCRISISRVDLFRRIMGWQAGAVEYFVKHRNLSISEDSEFVGGIVFRPMQKWSRIIEK